MIVDQLPASELGELGVGASTKEQVVSGVNARKTNMRPRPLGGRENS